MAILVRSDSVVPVGLISLYGFLTCSQRWLFAAVIGVFAYLFELAMRQLERWLVPWKGKV